MTTTVEELKRDLTGMLRRAKTGEEILITDGNVPFARITAVESVAASGDRKAWVEKLRRLHESTSTGKVGMTTDQILEEDRADR